MIFIALALAASAPGADLPGMRQTRPAGVFNPLPLHCRGTTLAKGTGSPGARKLTQLPPGNAYLAVYRTGPDGCIDPMLVSRRR